MDIFKKRKLSESIYPLFKEGRLVFYTPESLKATNNAIASTVETNIRNVQDRLSKAKKGSKEEKELAKELEELRLSEELISAPVKSERDAKSAIEEIDLVNKWLKSIAENGVRAQDILLMDKYRPFFDEATIERIEKMFAHLQTSFEVSDVLKRDENVVDASVLFKAKEKLAERERNVKLEKAMAADLKKAEEKSQSRTDKARDEYRSGKITYEEFTEVRREELAKIERMKKLMSDGTYLSKEAKEKALEEGEGMTEAEKRQYLASKSEEISFKETLSSLNKKSVGYLSGIDMDKIKSALVEIRNYRGLAIHEYIQSRILNIRKTYEERNWPVQDLDLLERGLKDRSYYLQDPDSIKALLKQLKHLELRTNAIRDAEDRLVTPEIGDKLRYVEREFEHFKINPEKAQAIASLIPNPDKGSVVYLKQAEGIASLANYMQFLADLKGSLRSTNEQERLHAKEALDNINKVLRRAEAEKAGRVINALRVATNMKEMMDAVIRNAGMDHIEMVKTSKEFRDKYGDYTSGGMVFYRKGDVWKVIIDEERINDPGVDLAKFRKEMTHEMHHVEFDYDEDIHSDEVKRFTSNEKWPEVKAAFVAKANSNKIAKKPPTYKGSSKKEYTVEDWKDEDVISELHAMQELINNHVVTQVGKRTPMDDLVSAITDAKLLPAALIAGFEGDDEEAEIRGYESDGEEPDTEQDKEYQKIGDSASSADEKTNEFQAQSILDRIEAMRKTGHVGNIPDAEEILKIVESKCKGKSSAEYLDSADGAISKVEEAVKSYSQKHPRGSGNPLRDVWNNTTFCAVEDFVQLGKSIYEFYSRRHKRRLEDHASRLGEGFFAHIPFLKELAMDSTANKEKAEAEYVNEWKGRFEHKDAWELLEMIDNMGDSNLPDKDQLKAILRILAEKGRIDWRRPGLWKVLNKLQSNVKFIENDQFLMQNPDALNQSLMSAMGAIWDYDEFQSLLNKNESAYDSKKNEYLATYEKMSGQLDARLADIFQQYQAGKEADPAEYEAIIEYAIQKGKSHQENVFFYMIIGMASGLLAADRGIHMDKHLNLFPPLDWFTYLSPPPTQQWFENLCNTYFPDEYKNGIKPKGGDSQFQNFYWTVVLNNKDVLERVQKSAAPDAWDHDWSRGIAAVGGADTVERFLSGRSGQKALRPTAAANEAGGFLEWFEENAKVPGTHWDKNIADQIAGITMFDGIMENVAYSDVKIYTRKEALIGKVVREGGIGYHGGQSADWHWRQLQKILDIIDPVLFGMLRDKSLRDRPSGDDRDKDGKKGVFLTDKITNHLKANYSPDPDMMDAINDASEINDIFKNLSHIIHAVVKQRPGQLEQVRKFLNKLSGTKVKAA